MPIFDSPFRLRTRAFTDLHGSSVFFMSALSRWVIILTPIVAVFAWVMNLGGE